MKRWAIVCAFLLVGCGHAEPAPEPAPTFDHTSIPTTDPDGQQFTFDDAATFPNGLRIQINEITAKDTTKDKDASEIHGAEGTDGHIVVAEVQVTNDTTLSLAGEQLQVWGFYGNVGAPKVVDASGALGDSFQGAIRPGERVTASMGWAIPADRTDDVTIMVQDNIPGHQPVRFTGPVK